jgi:chemotaxis protein MotB
VGKKQHHEEHQNHERWVISYADMVTLLFALFVVLYSLGEVKLKKLKELKKSLAFAFAFEGSGKTQDEGVFDKGQSGGVILQGLPMITAQKSAMKEFVMETLPDQFREITGASLEIVVTDDTIAFRAPLSSMFAAGKVPLEPEVQLWLKDLVEGVLTFANDIRVRIEAPNVITGRGPNGTALRSGTLSMQRLEHILKLLPLMPKVVPEKVQTEFRYTNASGDSWEDVGTISFAFANA